jgi:hypothetical protein
LIADKLDDVMEKKEIAVMVMVVVAVNETFDENR